MNFITCISTLSRFVLHAGLDTYAGGGCPHVNLMVNGSLRSPDQQICRWFQYALSETMKLLAELGDAGEDHIIQRIYQEGTAGQFDRSDTYA